MTAAATGAPGRVISLTIDGQAVCVPEGTTLLEACRLQGIATPTLCYLENLRPVNVCRVCVVEVEGSRALVPACSRRAESGMVVQTDSERVRLSRRLVLELLASSVDLSLTPTIVSYLEHYNVRPARFGTPTASQDRDTGQAGRHETPEGSGAATVTQPVKIDNDLYVRNYSQCILCYKCAESCGVEAQNTLLRCRVHADAARAGQSDCERHVPSRPRGRTRASVY